MRKIILIIIIIMLSGIVSPVYGVEAPEISAQYAIVIEMNSGKVLYEKNAGDKAYPASITKIMTALLAIEKREIR